MKKSHHLLSFVTNEGGEIVTIHIDRNGVDFLIQELESIRDRLIDNDCEHCHLFSDADIAGDSLSTSKLADQETEKNVVHAVKIYGWNTEWAVRHGLVEPSDQ